MPLTNDTPSYFHSLLAKKFLRSMKSDVQKPVKDDLINITLKASMGISHVTKTLLGRRKECILAVAERSLVATPHTRPLGHVGNKKRPVSTGEKRPSCAALKRPYATISNVEAELKPWLTRWAVLGLYITVCRATPLNPWRSRFFIFLF